MGNKIIKEVIGEMAWRKILNGEKILSDIEAIELEKILKELRGLGF